MRLLTFRGGIHPDDRKRATEALPIKELPAPETLIFPVSQHIGAPCEPCVKTGDRVCVGTKIADSPAPVSAPVHSSVSGEVSAIAPMPAPGGAKIMSVIIKNDFADELDLSVKPLGDYKNIAPDDIPARVREAGIVGMGGAAFPTHIKLCPPKTAKIDTVIINGAECEPYLTSDHRVMLETPEDIILGLKIVLYRFGIDNGYIGIEQNKPDAIGVISALAAREKGMKTARLRTKYPQGGERQLIRAITKREVPSGGLPSDVGVVVLNVDTCAAIARKFLHGAPLTRRIVTLSGGAVKTPANYSVRIGTPFDFLIEKGGGFITPPKKIVMGGPMMGVAQTRLDVPVVKGTSAILALTAEELPMPDESPCVRCGDCVRGCPMGLMPLYLNDYAVAGNLDKCEEFGITDCIECGCCGYLCPAKRHPVQAIRGAKQAVIARKRAAQAQQGGKRNDI